MDFPRLVYISPGKNPCQGGSFDYELAVDKANFDAALAAGYFATVPEALKAAESQAEPDTAPEPETKRRGRPRKED